MPVITKNNQSLKLKALAKK